MQAGRAHWGISGCFFLRIWLECPSSHIFLGLGDLDTEGILNQIRCLLFRRQVVLYDLKTMKFETAWSHRMSFLVRLEGGWKEVGRAVNHLAEALSRFQHVIAAGSAMCMSVFSLMSACQWLPLSFGQQQKSSTKNNKNFISSKKQVKVDESFSSIVWGKRPSESDQTPSTAHARHDLLKGCRGLLAEEVFAGRG